MDQIFKVINAYYNDFESYNGVISFKSFLFWIILFSLGAFFYSFYWYINLSAFPYFPDLSRLWRILICIAFEISTLASWVALIKRRDNIIVQRLQNRFQSKEANILKLKSWWFKETLGVKPIEYLSIIDTIDKAITYKDKHKSNFNFGKKQVLDSIFHSESKNRLWQ